LPGKLADCQTKDKDKAELPEVSVKESIKQMTSKRFAL
jgi:DNA gyrase/topoisomerase IV subunit B